MDALFINHPEHGLAKVGKTEWESDGKAGHGWSKKEAEQRGWAEIDPPAAPRPEKAPKSDKK